jgi:hypothetical protein
LYASQQSSLSTQSANGDSPTLPENTGVQGDPLERITSPLPGNRVNPILEPPALSARPDLVEQAVSRLNEAAHLIEQEEDQGKVNRKARHYSRASRLTPIVDISADIRRESTPLPNFSNAVESEAASKDDLKRQIDYDKLPAPINSGSDFPDYWPWLDIDTEDKDSDIWANRTDPLISRHIPTSAEAASIEEEDMRRAMADGMPTAQLPVSFVRRNSSRIRAALISLAILALIALAVDGILLNVSFTHPHNERSGKGGLPTMTLSSNAAKVGDTVTITLTHFTPAQRVALTHDIQEPIPINGSATVSADAQGTARIPMVIDATWGPGFHLLVAEDVATRNTADATLQITGQGPTPPPHLLLDTTPINMGADLIGANTIRTLTLENGGGGSIAWSASSNQPWLLVAPSQGLFSQQQTISLAVQRVGLKAGDYHGSLTISTNVGVPQRIEVDMTVRPLPPNAGPVLAVTPALLSFTTSDGNAQESVQALTISNPGSHPLNWSVVPVQGLTCTWLRAMPTTGLVAPGASSTLSVVVQSQCLLPGTYLATLKFTGMGAIDGAQMVNVSLAVQPHCGLVTSTGYLAFTVVQGQNTLLNQTVSLNATASCAGTSLPWTSTSTAPWLSITPASGQLRGTTSSVVSVSVNAASLLPKTYNGDLSLVSGQSTLTIMVQLTVQTPPPPTAPIMGTSTLSLNFSSTQGQPSPTGQVVTILNNGKSPLMWNARPQPLATSWLGAYPSGGTIAPGQSGQLTVTIATTNLTPGSYVGLVTLNGMDTKGNPAPGSPQNVTVTLVVQPPCTMSPPSSSVLSFSAVQGATINPAAQTVVFTGTGNCVWPVTWTTSLAHRTPWLTLTPSTGGTLKGTGQSGSLVVTTNITGLTAKTYSTQVTIAATDSTGATVQGSPQTFEVTLTILPPCVLAPASPASLSFTLPLGQATAPPQTLALIETGTCSRPVTWTASANSAWLALSATSGTDSGSGSSLGVNVTAATLLSGTYSGTITITATDSTGASVGGQTVSVTLTVTSFTVSGTVLACPGSTPPTCTTPQALPGATLTLTGGSTTLHATADGSGNYTFAGVPLGTYTITASGTDVNSNRYVGTATVTVTGNAQNVIIQAFPG